MTCADARAQRFAKAWWGPSLAALVGIGGTVELAAMPVALPGAQLPGPILIQQSSEPQTDVQQPAGTSSEPARAETAPDSFIELHEALAAARERLEELSRAAEAVAATGQLQRELTALQEQNRQLQAAIAAARAGRAELATGKEPGGRRRYAAGSRSLRPPPIRPRSRRRACASASSKPRGRRRGSAKIWPGSKRSWRRPESSARRRRRRMRRSTN